MEVMVDSHLHSHHSGDATGSIDEFCQQALKVGVTDLYFTEHLDYDLEEGRMRLPFDPEAYFAELEAARKRYQDRLKLYAGLEAGDPHYYPEDYRALIGEYDFDLIIASAHMMDGYFVGDQEFLAERTLREIFDQYFQSIREMLSEPHFDVLGHLDFPQRYLQGAKDYNWSLLEDILSRTVEKGLGIEINTSALRKGCKEPCPGEEILRFYYRLGGRIVIVGSDAHRPQELGSDIDRALDLMREVGFSQWYQYIEGHPHALPL